MTCQALAHCVELFSEEPLLVGDDHSDEVVQGRDSSLEHVADFATPKQRVHRREDVAVGTLLVAHFCRQDGLLLRLGGPFLKVLEQDPVEFVAVVRAKFQLQKGFMFR